MTPPGRGKWNRALRGAGLALLVIAAVPLLVAALFMVRAAVFGAVLAAAAVGLVAYPFSPRLRAWVEAAEMEASHEG